MDRSATEIAGAVLARRVSPVEIVEAALERIEERNPTLNAFVHVCTDRALDDAHALAKRIARDEDVGPLAGVPFGVKDLEDVAGLPTTYGSAVFANHVAPSDSVQVARLRAAGGIVVGKTNTPEFGYTGFTHNRLFGTTRNPWNPERTPGGSSGGSAAAVAGRMVPLATASDGGGSVRIPACYVGAFGMKPTFGRIPIGPEEALGMQRWVDTVHYGPITRTVADGALMIDVAAGYHPNDPSSLPRPSVSYREALESPLAGLRIAFSPDPGYGRVQSDVADSIRAAVEEFRRLGHAVDEVRLELPDLGRGWAFMCGAENWAEIVDRVKGREADLGRGFWAGLEAARTLSLHAHGEFQRQRTDLNSRLAALFSRYDLLLTPTLPTEAFAARGPLPSEVDGVALDSPIHAVAFAYPFNLSGHPAATIRAGFTRTGLPTGLQLVAERHRDELVLQAARAFERVCPMTEWP
jgi:aspartyl-tRNA(Asn)/glutamyl-tRNA(Gln) amidotransferase subunit A